MDSHLVPRATGGKVIGVMFLNNFKKWRNFHVSSFCNLTAI